MFVFFSFQVLIEIFYLDEPKALKGISIGIALTTLSQLTANFTITNYAVMIFEKAGSQIDPYVSSIALALSLLLGALFTTYLVCIITMIDQSIQIWLEFRIK